MNDLKFAFRQLLKTPGFTAVAVLTLALGIGANTAIFSLVNGVLLKPLPYPEPDRLVTLWERSPQRGIEQERVSGPNYLDWRAQNSVLADLAASPGWVGSEDFNLVLRDTTIKVPGSYTSASLFTTLGTKPLLGRTLLPEEDRKGGPRVAVLSYGLWQRHFAGDSNVIGQTLTVDTYGRRDYTIVGVMPSGFGVPSRCQLWLPLGWMGVTLDERRSAHWHNVIARLKSSVTIAQAQSELTAIQARIKQAHSGETIGSEVAVVPLLHQALGRNMRTALLVLWGVVAGVLLIACANVANLMLARAAARQKEIALRLALGAGRWRVMRQLLIESIVLAMVGGVFGVLLGWSGLRLFIAASPANIPRLNEVTLDLTVLGFTLGISALTGVLFGLAPAWQFSRPNLNEALKEGTRAASGAMAASRTRNALVVAEVALSVLLLAGAGLMLQSFARMLRVERGFQSEHLLTAELDFSVSGFTTWVRPTATRPQVPLRELIERLRALPGVQAVGAGSRLLRRENVPPSESLAIFGRPMLKPEEQPKAEYKGITPDWLRALGARVLRGRDFTEADILEGPGVVQPEAVPEVYQSYWQWPMQNPTLLVRTTGDPATLAEAIRRETKAVIPNLPPPLIRTMDDLFAESIAQPRLQTELLSLFAAVALLLAAVGLYGVLAYAVTQRQREIGVRLALGAQRRTVLSLVIGQGMRLALVGVIIGVLCALALTRVLQSLLYGVTPSDPLTFAAVSLLLIATALLACWLPARRAANLNPMVALRYE